MHREVKISVTQVNLAVASLREILHEWREKPLGEVQYIIVDAQYEKVSEAGHEPGVLPFF
jgi:transposase-like protein